MRKNRYFYTLSTFYTKLKSHTNRKSDIICSFAPHNVCQSLAKQKKSKKNNSFAPHNVCQSLPKPKKTKKKQKKTKKQKNKKKHTPTPRSSPSHGFVFFFLVFSRFLLLLVESLKKTKKKQKKTHPNPPDPLHPMGLFFLFFLVFSRFLLLLVESLKKQKLFNILIITSAIQRFDSHSLNSFGKASESTNFCSHFCDSRPFTLPRDAYARHFLSVATFELCQAICSRFLVCSTFLVCSRFLESARICSRENP